MRILLKPRRLVKLAMFSMAGKGTASVPDENNHYTILLSSVKINGKSFVWREMGIQARWCWALKRRVSL
jgi:hypothetical protein